MDPKKVRKKAKRKHKFDQLRRLKALRQIKKYGALYHGIDTTKDFKSEMTLVDDPENEEIESAPPITEDDLYFDGMKKRDLYHEDYTDVDVDDIRSETYRMEQYYHGDESTKQNEFHHGDHPDAESLGITVIDSNVSEFGSNFGSLGIGRKLVNTLESKGICEPTDIQRKVIPHLLSKCGLVEDVNVESDDNLKDSKSKQTAKHIVELTVFGERTGTGKTLGYLLPILEAIKRDTERHSIPLRMSRPRAIILAPTRELCEQIRAVICDLAPSVGVSSCVLTAGTSTRNQLKKLRTGVDIVVGTPQVCSTLYIFVSQFTGQGFEACSSFSQKH